MKREDVISLCKALLLWGVAILVCWLLSGCKTQLMPVPEVHIEYIHDTLQVHDSIHIHTREYVKGDTVYKDSIVYRYLWRDKVVEAYKVDSIPYPVKVEKIVAVRSGYDRFCSWAFWIIVAIVLLYVVWWCFKKFYLRR